MNKLIMGRVDVNVTQNDINIGIPGDCSSCAMAIAVARTLGADLVNIGDSWSEVVIRENGTAIEYSYSNSGEMHDFIKQFDSDDEENLPEIGRYPMEYVNFTILK